jgi:spore coat protein A
MAHSAPSDDAAIEGGGPPTLPGKPSPSLDPVAFRVPINGKTRRWLMIDRRKFLEAGAAVGVGAMMPVKVARAAETMSRASGANGAGSAAAPGVSPPLAKFVDVLPLPIGPAFTYQPNAMVGGVPYYEIPVTAFTQKLHRDLPPTYLWGYGGTFPSRTIEATVGKPIRVRFRNDLKNKDVHPVASGIDRVNVDGVDGFPDQRISTHLHGGHVPWTSDGGPKGWYTRGPNPLTFPVATSGYYVGVNFYNGDTFDYPNNQPGTTLWFHDHAMGITRVNVIAGLAGFWLLRDPNESLLNLPSFPYEIPLAIQDRIFNADGSLYYPPPPEVPEFFGDTMLVNGKVWPLTVVEPRKYRLRLLNGCNARFLRMQLVTQERHGVNVPWVQIGAEGGFLPAPTAPFNTLLMAPAERADVIVDFSAVAGKDVLLFNDASTPFSNTASTLGAIPEVMLFRVTAPLSGTDTSAVPANFTTQGLVGNPFPDITNAATRIHTLDEITLPNGMLMQLIDLAGYERSPYTGPVNPDMASVGSTEIWSLFNTTVDVHPIHTHQTMFKVLDRQAFNNKQYLLDRAKLPPGTNLDPTPYIIGQPMPPASNETGWKDTIKANPGEVARIAMRWEDYVGHYVYHCHILEHEEHDMMHALEIVGP